MTVKWNYKHTEMTIELIAIRGLANTTERKLYK